MNTPTMVASLVFAGVLVVLIAWLISRMLRGWRRRAERQIALVGQLPTLPDTVGQAVVAPTKGLYVGSTLAPRWLDRIAAGDLGYRSKAVITRYPEGIMVQRSGASPIWIPQDSILSIRTETGLAGKVVPAGRNGDGEPQGGILAIRWRLPSGTEIDTGFRGDNRGDYAKWLIGGADGAEIA